MRIDGDVLIFQPTLPRQWRSYRFRVRYRGALLELRVDAEKVHLQAMEGAVPVAVRAYGQDCQIDAQGISVDQRQPGQPTARLLSWPYTSGGHANSS